MRYDRLKILFPSEQGTTLLATAAVLAATLIAAAIAVFIVILAIRTFGANNVQAFAGVMSFLAVVVAAIATVVYVRKTADIAQAARESAQATRETAAVQASVARLMDADLRFRIAPYLRYQRLPGSALTPEGVVCNSGNGMAVDIKARVRIDPSGREVTIEITPRLEPREDYAERIWFKHDPNEGKYSIILTCTDSLYLSDYRFEWPESGRITSYSVTPHEAH